MQGQRKYEVDGASDSPSEWHREAEPSYARFLGIDMQLLHRVRRLVLELKGSVGEGPNQTNYSDRSSIRILGIQRKPRKGTSSK